MLNLIENISSIIKSNVRQNLSIKINEILNNHYCISIYQQRLQALEQLIQEALTLVTFSMCIGYINNCAKQYANAIQEILNRILINIFIVFL